MLAAGEEGRDRGRAGRALAVIAVVAAVAWPAGSSYGHSDHSTRQGPQVRATSEVSGRSTLEQTITGRNPNGGFSFLEPGPGEPYVLRQDLTRAQAGREQRRRSLLYAVQLSDFQLSDEESPARVEFLDALIASVASSAWRPQEAFVAHETDRTIRQVNQFLDSPVTQGDGSRARLLNAVLTGDLADNQQRNETEWVAQLLRGGTVHPNSGQEDTSGSVCPPGTPLDDPDNYTGVQDYDDYNSGMGSTDFYDPDEPAGQYSAWPTYPGLMDRAQQPFQAEGLRIPSYVAFGNHDALVQGNEDANAAFEDIATGCFKPFSLPPPPAPIAPGAGSDALPRGFSRAFDPRRARAAAEAQSSHGTGFFVPPDERRQFVDKRQFKDIFRTTGQEDAHGFAYISQEELDASQGSASYYSFAPKPGIRYIVLDTVSEGGVTPQSSDGNIDDPQFKWLERELQAATRRNELILVFGHHATGSLTSNIPDEVAGDCRLPPNNVNDEHGHATNPGCDRDPRASTPLHLGDDVEALFHRFPHVIAFVAGHSHENRVAPFKKSGGGDFWEIKSPAVVDYPPQHRLIEVMDNRDGTLSIFGTMLDLDAPIRSPAGGTSAASMSAETLGSIGRTLTFNDPQVGPADFANPEGGEGGPDGTRRDRNVELLIRDPRRVAAAQTEDQGGGPGDGDDGGDGGDDRDDDEERRPSAAGGGGGLPFTGLPILPVAVLGALLALAGALAALRSRRRPAP